MAARSFPFQRSGWGCPPTSGDTPLAEAQAVPFSPGGCLLGSSRGPTPTQREAVWAQWLQPLPSSCPSAPLLCTPSKPGEGLGGGRGHRERIWRSECRPSPVRCFKDRICAQKAPHCPEATRLGGGWWRGGTGKGLEEGLCKAAARNLGSQSGFCQEAPGREAPGQHLGAAADKLCDPDPREPTAGLCSHLSKPRAGPPPRPITH